MYLCRIKNAEQLKHISSGEFGKLLGLDRIPEAKTFREKIGEIVAQKGAEKWNRDLAQEWVKEEGTNFFYVDGHVKVYTGHAANLGKKHVSRLQLCLPGVMEFWINNSQGMPYFVVSSEVNEKMQEMLKTKIVAELKDHVSIKISDQALKDDPDLPRFNLVFDREISSPEYFNSLWAEHRVSILTYRKNVKDHWPESDFKIETIEIDGIKTSMCLAEKETVLDGVPFREVRKKCDDGHQTSIITNNKKINLVIVAINMFARWAQEIFFKYLKKEYDLDRIVHYAVNKIDDEFKVVNPIYSKLTNSLKLVRQQISRRQANLYQAIHEKITGDADKTEAVMKKQIAIKEEIKILETKEIELLTERKCHKYHITVKEMSEKARYNKLDMESKLFQNVIKMICYRAETNCAMQLAVDYKKKVNEMRALTKSLIYAKANIIPDQQNNTLTIELYSLATPRDNSAVEKICQLLNDTQTIFPGTNMALFYKTATG